MINRKLFIFVFIILFALTSNALGIDGAPRGKWWHDSLMSKKLNLTEKESQTIDALFIESMRRMIDLKSAVEKERFELRNLLENKIGNDAAVKEQFKNLEKARSAIAIERLQFLISIREILGIKRFRELSSSSENFRKDRRKNDRLQ
ncbi:MAG: periplasmic heavy metal sensor [Proteobacteria bacterium]|nr:periplasmic heavy metal sensor [Pseudomonadota bacterium]